MHIVSSVTPPQKHVINEQLKGVITTLKPGGDALVLAFEDQAELQQVRSNASVYGMRIHGKGRFHIKKRKDQLTLWVSDPDAKIAELPIPIPPPKHVYPFKTGSVDEVRAALHMMFG